MAHRMETHVKMALLGALLALLGGCTQKFPAQVSDVTCKAGEILGGAGTDAPLKCIPLASLSTDVAQHAAHAAEVDQAAHAQKVDTALFADRGLSLARGLPLVLGTDAPAAGASVLVEGGPIFVDGHPLTRYFLQSAQSAAATSGTTSSVLLSLSITPKTAGTFRFTLNGSVGAAGNPDGSAYGLCQVRLEVDNVSTSTTVASFGTASPWALSAEISLLAAPYTLTVSLLSNNAVSCEEDPAGGTFHTRPAMINVEVVGA